MITPEAWTPGNNIKNIFTRKKKQNKNKNKKQTEQGSWIK